MTDIHLPEHGLKQKCVLTVCIQVEARELATSQYKHIHALNKNA